VRGESAGVVGVPAGVDGVPGDPSVRGVRRPRRRRPRDGVVSPSSAACCGIRAGLRGGLPPRGGARSLDRPERGWGGGGGEFDDARWVGRGGAAASASVVGGSARAGAGAGCVEASRRTARASSTFVRRSSGDSRSTRRSALSRSRSMPVSLPASSGCEGWISR